MANELQNIFLNCFNYCILTVFTTLVHCCGLFCSEETSKQTSRIRKRIEDTTVKQLIKVITSLVVNKKYK